MTVFNAADNLRVFTADGVQTVFPVTFSFSDADDLRVMLRTAATEKPSQLSLLSDYTVSGNTLAKEGAVMFVVPPAATARVIVERLTPPRQTLELDTSDNFRSEVVEDKLDDLARQIGDVKRRTDRSILFDIEDTAGPKELEPQAARPDTLMGFDETGAFRLLGAEEFVGAPTRINATGTLAGRAVYDDEAALFAYLATDQIPAVVSFKQSGATGDWSPWLPWGRGPKGDSGDSGPLTGRLEPGQPLPWLTDTLPSAAYLFANYETIGDIGSGADYESADYYDAFQVLKNSPWNSGAEDWSTGDTVFLPDMREVVLAGAGAMGGASSPLRMQRATTLSTTLGQATATVGTAAGLSVGMHVLGNPNVPAGTTITDISGVTVTLSANATATASTVAARFSILSDPQVIGSVGGADTHRQLLQELVAHAHNAIVSGAGGHSHQYQRIQNNDVRVPTGNDADAVLRESLQNANTTGVGDHVHGVTIENAGHGLPMPNLQPTLICNWIVFVAPAQGGPSIVPLSQGDRLWEYAGAAGAGIPGNGKFRLDGVPSAATALYVDNEDPAGLDLSAIWLNLPPGSVLEIFDMVSRGRFAQYTITGAPTASAGYVAIPLSFQAGASADSIEVGHDCALSVARAGGPGVPGDPGADGADPGILLTWDADTADADQGAGAIWADNADLSLATTLYLSKTNRGGSDIAAFLAALTASTNPSRKGGITLTRPGDGAQATFDLTALTDAAGYVKLAVSGHAGAIGFSATDAISFQFARDGDKGADGAGAVDSVNGRAGAVTLSRDDVSGTGADIASAPAIDLDAATGDLIDITGTTAITGITLAEGRERTVRFAGALTLTHGVSLILPGAANIATEAGDFAVFRGYAAGVVRCIAYVRAAALPLYRDRPGTLTAGFDGTPYDAGTQAGGTFTPVAANGNLQRLVNGGSFTLAPPATDTSIVVKLVNNASAGGVTATGFTQSSGDPFTSTNGHAFLCWLTRVDGSTHLHRVALQ